MKLYVVQILFMNSMHMYVSNVLIYYTHLHVILYLEKNMQAPIYLIQLPFTIQGFSSSTWVEIGNKAHLIIKLNLSYKSPTANRFSDLDEIDSLAIPWIEGILIFYFSV